METENNGMNEFVGEFEAFHRAIRQKAGEMGDEQVVTLYAIFKKNGRAERLNGMNGYQKKDPNEPATDKQKAAIERFVKQGRIPEVDLKTLTKREASVMIKGVLG